jgi:hypothetical protein
MSHWWYVGVEQPGVDPLGPAEAQEFLRQANDILLRFEKPLRSMDRKFGLRSRSRRKALWLLYTTAHASLRDALDEIQKRRLSAAAALLRTADEAMSLAGYLGNRSVRSTSDLRKWYQDGAVDPSRVDAWTENENKESGSEAEQKARDLLLRLTRPSHGALLPAFAVDPGRRMAYAGFNSRGADISAKVLVDYCVVLAWLIARFGRALARSRITQAKTIHAAWIAVLGEDVQCTIRTKDGYRCRRYAVGHGRCWQHRYAT